MNIKVQQSWPKCVLCICLFILLALICVPFLFLVMSGLAAACNCGTPWTYLWFVFKEIYWRQIETLHQKCCITCYMYIMQVRKCGLSWFLVVFHTVTYWKFGSVFNFFQNLGGSVIYKDAPCARGTSIHWYLPISEGAPYILPVFWENLPTKMWEFPALSYTSPYLKFMSPYQNLRISFFV